MLDRVQDAPADTLALRASGTIVARDVEAAIEAAIGASTASTGVVIVIDRDFDGYFAELARGLANSSLAHKNCQARRGHGHRPHGRSQTQRLRRLRRADPSLRREPAQRRVQLGWSRASGGMKKLHDLFRRLTYSA